jgi:hypothetical protein
MFFHKSMFLEKREESNSDPIYMLIVAAVIIYVF